MSSTVVEVYTRSGCGPCAKLKEYLDWRSIPYREYVYGRDFDAESLKERMHTSSNKITVPQVFVDGVYVGDYDATYEYFRRVHDKVNDPEYGEGFQKYE